MAERYKISIKVVSQTGRCAQEHKIGDQWIIDMKTPEGVCPSAWHSLYPGLQVLMFGGIFPWQVDPDVTNAACPDAKNPVVFELRRLHE